MATIQIFAPIDMHNANSFVGTLVAYDSNHIQFANHALIGPMVGTYYGSFSYDASGNVFGTLTGYTSTRSGVLQWSVSGLNFPMATAIPLIDNNDLQQLFSEVLSGNDQFILSPDAHGGLDVIDGYGGYNIATEPLPYSQYSITNEAASLYVLSTTFDTLYNIQEINFPDGSYNTQSGIFTSYAGLLGVLSLNQQLELIYIAYFNRAADNAGFTFWSGQNTQAQGGSRQTATVALTNIANSFAPQSETVAIYSFLAPLVSGGTINLNSPAAQSGLTAFVRTVYQNLFNRIADSIGQNYWVGQITGGAVGLGAAALAIANGATGTDAIEVQNKISVALDFTTRTNTANLGTTAPLTNSFVTAAKGVLSGVDGTSLNDVSVSAGMSATTDFIYGLGTGRAIAAATNADTPIIISMSNAVIDPGVDDHTISFIAGTGADTLVLHAGGVDQVSGFDPTTGILDLRLLLSEANVDLTRGIAILGGLFTVVAQEPDALVRFDRSGHGGGNTVADLQGLGGSVPGLEALIAQQVSRIA